MFVHHLAGENTHGTFTLERVRYLESTNDQIETVLRVLSREAIECLCSWPCVFMQEGRGAETARIVRIRSVTATAAEVTATMELLPESIELANASLWRLRNELDLGQYEFNRNHWAVKDRDLFAILAEANVPVPAAASARFTERPIPVATRAELLATRQPLAAMEHGEIDDLLLEAGIPDLPARRGTAGRLDRARAIVQYAIEHPEALTAENFLFSQFLLRKARAAGAATPALAAAPVAAPTPAPAPAPAPATAETRNPSPNRVFVVHGRNEEAREAVVAFLESVGLEAIVLHQQASMGRHLLTKFIQEAELVTFAVVVMTDDDEGRARDGTLAPRARQNVILELGYFLAHLSQPMVCALVTPGLETPSDFDGIVYIRMAGDRRWEVELLRELVAANMPVTTTAVPRR